MVTTGHLDGDDGRRSGAGAPALGRLHHVGLTVNDVVASEAWYCRVLGLERLSVEHHNGGSGHTVLLHRPGGDLDIGLDHHPSHEGDRFEEHRTGLDHVSIHVEERADLDLWAAYLDWLDVRRGEITDVSEPFPFATLVFRDPDNIQLELIWV